MNHPRHTRNEQHRINVVKTRRDSRAGHLLMLVLVQATLALAAPPARACTIFVLTDANHALFCNNEDWSNPQARVWFIPAGEGYNGAAYVGFDDGLPQGGLNTEGLAYDWVMVSKTPQEWKSGLPPTRGPACQRMLETCATVKDAIAFYRKYDEPIFATSAILIADKTGASAIMGVRNGQMVVEESHVNRGFGFGRRAMQTALDRRAALPKPPEPTVTEAFTILHDCRQVGEYSTKYSNVFDLKSGDIFLRPFSEREGETSLNLARELKKGAHYYEIPAARLQVTVPLRALPPRMQRFPLEAYKPIPDNEPKVAIHARDMLRDINRGTPKVEDFSSEFWKSDVAPFLADARARLERLGGLVSLTLVDREDNKGLRSYRYRAEFANGTALLHLVLDTQNKVTLFSGEDLQWKPASKPRPSLEPDRG
jgi:hypothetical protein